MGRREKRQFNLLGTRRWLKHNGTPVSSNLIKKTPLAQFGALSYWRDSLETKTLNWKQQRNLTIEGYVQIHRRPVTTHNSHKY